MRGDSVTVTVLGVKGNQVRIGITAPKEVAVHREEIFQRIQRDEAGKAKADVGLRLSVEAVGRGIMEREAGEKIGIIVNQSLANVGMERDQVLAAGLGVPVVGVIPLVVDRGRAVGGRMASRTLRDTGTAFDGRVVDIGASYFTVSTPEFRAVVDDWLERDIARAWTDSFL